MKRIDKWRVKIKDHVLVSSAYYLILVLTLQCAGKIQGTFYNKEVNQYKEIVEDFSDFLDEKEIDDPKLIFDYFNYALWNGYLSSDHDFAFNRDNKTLLSNFGMACIMGKSVCLNNANMLRDLYEAMGYDSTVFNCYYLLDKAKIELFDYQKDIKQASDEKKNDEDGIYLPYVPGPFELIIGNHAITAVYYDGEYYYYDPTNLLYLSKSDLNDLDILNGDGTMKIRKISTFLFELEESFKGLFHTNEYSQLIYNSTYSNMFKLFKKKYSNSPEIKEVIPDFDKMNDFYHENLETVKNIAMSYSYVPRKK